LFKYIKKIAPAFCAAVLLTVTFITVGSCTPANIEAGQDIRLQASFMDIPGFSAETTRIMREETGTGYAKNIPIIKSYGF